MAIVHDALHLLTLRESTASGSGAEKATKTALAPESSALRKPATTPVRLLVKVKVAGK
jgi:hypothetical protein